MCSNIVSVRGIVDVLNVTESRALFELESGVGEPQTLPQELIGDILFLMNPSIRM